MNSKDEFVEEWRKGDDLKDLGLKAGLCKILRFWIGTTLDLEPKSVGGDAWSPIQARSHILSFSDLNKPPTSYPPLYNGDVGRGWLPLFWAFRAMGGRVGDSYRASAVKAWGLVILLCRGNPILRDATTPRNPACDKELKHLWLTEDYIWGFEQKAAGLKKEGKIWASSQVFSTCSSFLSLPARSHSLSVCLSLNEHPPTISIQMVSSLQDSPQPARGLHQQNCQLWCWLGRGRVIGRIREDIPGKGTSTQWKRLDDGDAPGKHVLGIFCKEGKRKHRSTGHESTC